jgi:hypothetical protein
MAHEPSSPKKVAVLTGLTMLAGGVEVSRAIADTTTPETHGFNLTSSGSGPPAVTDILTFQKFNQSGTLTGVTFTLDSQFIDPLASTGGSLVSSYAISIQVDNQPAITSQSFGAALPHTFDITNPPGLSGLVGALDQNFYTGSGTFLVTLGIICGTAANGCEGGVKWVGDNSTGANETGLTLTYTFNPTPIQTPLPAALPLFATGLGGLGLAAWRSRRKQKLATEG